jgi:transposase-like protein
MRSVPTIDELHTLIPDESRAMQYLESKKVFYTEMQCEQCGSLMRRIAARGVFRCETNQCKDRQVSIRAGTFFHRSNLSVRNILRLGHLWLSGVSHRSAVGLTGHSSGTVTNFYGYFRQLVTQSLTEEDQVIGGPGIEVELDETKLGKRKYNRGHRVEGVWVVVGVERTGQGKVFVLPVENRNAETLTRIVATHVAEGSIVNTDCWRGYSGLVELAGIRHQTVNHSRNFVDPTTGACTNTVEGVNSGLKRKIAVRNRVRSGIEGHLGEYVWRKKAAGALWNQFIRAIADVHYD